MENKESILSKIKSKYVFNNIMDYCFDYCLKYRLLKYSKNLQNKFDITKIEYQKISSIIKYKLISPEYIIETKNKLMEDLSKNDENTINELMNRIVMTSYKKELKEFFENNIYDYFEIKNEKMVNILIEHSILINKTNVEIRLNEELLNDKKFIKFIEKALNYKSEILFTFITQNENINNNFLQKINELKIYNLPRISIDFPYYKNIEPNNILEFYYYGAMSSNDFKIINNFQNLTHLKLINNMEDFTALINFKNLIYLSIINCPKANILLDTEEIAKNLKYHKSLNELQSTIFQRSAFILF
jgi:hypothetical protein